MKHIIIMGLCLLCLCQQSTFAKSYVTQYPTNQIYEDSIRIPHHRHLPNFKKRYHAKQSTKFFNHTPKRQILNPYYRVSSPHNQQNYNYNNYNRYENYKRDINAISDLAKYEKMLFQRTFKGENDLNRISRVEQELFGTIHSGDINKRCENIRRAISGQNNTYRTSGFLSGLGNLFSRGYPTGFSPNLDSLDLGGYNDSGGFLSEDNWMNKNYYEFQNAMNSGMGVHIID